MASNQNSRLIVIIVLLMLLFAVVFRSFFPSPSALKSHILKGLSTHEEQPTVIAPTSPKDPVHNIPVLKFFSKTANNIENQ